MVMMQDGFTPLLVSSQKGHVGVVEVLLKNGASVEGATPVGVVLCCCVVGSGVLCCCVRNECCVVGSGCESGV